MTAAKRPRQVEWTAAEEAANEAWLERQLAKAPPLTWEKWADGCAILGIKVKRHEGGGAAPSASGS